jgi:hypothetical protein|tara:strand:- start:276 stop:416 length:141 start_codon:yes stop_codon:yes gene_type:complete
MKIKTNTVMLTAAAILVVAIFMNINSVEKKADSPSKKGGCGCGCSK